MLQCYKLGKTEGLSRFKVLQRSVTGGGGSVTGAGGWRRTKEGMRGNASRNPPPPSFRRRSMSYGGQDGGQARRRGDGEARELAAEIFYVLLCFTNLYRR